MAGKSKRGGKDQEVESKDEISVKASHGLAEEHNEFLRGEFHPVVNIQVKYK